MRAHPAFGVDVVYEAHICSGLFFGGVSPSVLSIPDVARHFDFKASYMIVVGDVLAPPQESRIFECAKCLRFRTHDFVNHTEPNVCLHTCLGDALGGPLGGG